MRVPTDKEIEEAKEYLRQRLDAELSMRTNLQIVMIEAAKQIIDISYRYKISPELFRFSANRQLHFIISSSLSSNVRTSIFPYTSPALLLLSTAKALVNTKE